MAWTGDKAEDGGVIDQHELFVREYLIDMSATKAYIRAGYAPEDAPSNAYRLLARPDIRKRIAEGKRATFERLGITHDRILVQLARLGFTDARGLYDPDTGALRHPNDWPDDIAACVEQVETVTRSIPVPGKPAKVEYITKVKLTNKRASLELIGKHLKMFVDRVDLTTNGESLHARMTDLEAAARLKRLLTLAAERKLKGIRPPSDDDEGDKKGSGKVAGGVEIVDPRASSGPDSGWDGQE